MRLLTVLILSFLLSGCFGFSFWFERLDTLTLWRLDSMFDLSSEQEEDVEPVLEELQDWLRHDGFPDAVTRLQEVEALWLEGESEAAYLQLEQHAETVIHRFLVASWPRIKPLLGKLTAENAANYLAYGEEKMPDWFDEAESVEAKLEDRIDHFEDWFGDLTDAQVRLVAEHTWLMPDEYNIRIENSRQRRQQFMDLALAGDFATLETLYTEPVNAQTEAYRLWREQEKEQIRQSLVNLFPTLTDQQRRHAAAEIRDWIESLQMVIGPQPVNQPAD